MTSHDEISGTHMPAVVSSVEAAVVLQLAVGVCGEC